MKTRIQSLWNTEGGQLGIIPPTGFQELNAPVWQQATSMLAIELSWRQALPAIAVENTMRAVKQTSLDTVTPFKLILLSHGYGHQRN